MTDDGKIPGPQVQQVRASRLTPCRGDAAPRPYEHPRAEPSSVLRPPSSAFRPPSSGFCLTALLLALLLLLPPGSSAHDIPETLTYRLTWLGIRVGTSTLETRRSGECLEIVSAVASAAWTAPFYQVADREVSCLRPAGAGVEQGIYRKTLREGALRVDRTIEIDPAAGTIRHADLMTGARSEIPFAGEAWDPVASMHVVRSRPLRVGETVRLELLDNDRPNPVEIRVLRRETVETPAGTFPALVVLAESNLDADGLFYARGALTVWLSDDAEHRPLRIDKQIHGLFAQGIPAWLRPLVPDAMLNSPKLETVRAELVERR